MRKFLFGCTLALGCLTAPQAFADYCYPCDPCDSGCCADFNGFYVGGNVGVYSDTVHINDLDGFFTHGGTRVINTTNVTAGVIVGYDWQWCNKLLGIVADWNWVNNQNDDTSISGEFSHSSLDWFTTIRGRAGITVCDALAYVTLGAAVLGHDIRGGSDSGQFNRSFTRWGWASGVGIEYLLGCNWSVAGEILCLNFSNKTVTEKGNQAGAAGAFRLGFSHNAYVGRVILNYRFGNLFSCL